MQFDFATLTANQRYKLLSSTVVPRPIAWVVTINAEGLVNAAPFSFFNIFGSNPPVVVLGLARKAGGVDKDTGGNIRRSGQFVVNLVSEELIDAMSISAIDFGPTVSEPEEAGLALLPSLKVAPPRIAQSPVTLECEVMHYLDTSDTSSLVVGRVLAMHIADHLVLDPEQCHIDTRRLNLIGRMENPAGYVRTNDQFIWPRVTREEWERKG